MRVLRDGTIAGPDKGTILTSCTQSITSESESLMPESTIYYCVSSNNFGLGTYAVGHIWTDLLGIGVCGFLLFQRLVH